MSSGYPAWSCALAVVLVASAPSPAVAQGPPLDDPAAVHERLLEEARAAHAIGDYETCADRFERAHAMDSYPNSAWNALKCRELAGPCSRISELEAFLSARPDEEGWEDARAWVKARRAECDEAEGQSMAPLEALQPEAPAEDLEPEAPPEPLGPEVDASPPASDPLDTWALATTVGGSALLAGGAISIGLAFADKQKVEGAPVDPATGHVLAHSRTDAQTIAARAELEFGLGVGLVAAGTAALVAGLVLWSVGGDDADGAAGRDVGVMVGPTPGGLVALGRF